MDFLIAQNFCNPDQLVQDQRKTELRERFFRRFLEQCEVHMVNTTGPPLETQQVVREIACRGGEEQGCN